MSITITGDVTQDNGGGNYPIVSDVLWSDDGEGSPITPTFRVDAIQDNGGDNFTYTCTRTAGSGLPSINDLLFESPYGGYFVTVTEAPIEFAPPSDVVTYKRLVAAANNKIWYEDI